jgi:nucleoside-diphosphate-sugar epimerase
MGYKENTMNIMVTGGGGFIGSALVRELVKKGYSVTSFSRSDHPDLKSIGVKIIQGDVSDSYAVIKACQDMDIVFHVAAKAGIAGAYKEFFSTNVTGTQNIVNACIANNIRWLIYTSSASVVFNGRDIEGANESLPYPSSYLSYYTATKALAEKVILQSNCPSLRTIALRPHIVYGIGDNHLVPRVVEQARQGKLKKIGNGKNLIDVSYIDNVVDAHINAIQAITKKPEVSGRAFFITNGEPVLLWDFLNRILESSGLEPLSKSVPAWIAYIMSLLAEVIHKTIRKDSEPVLTRFLVRELSRSHWFDISNAINLLNYNPAISNIEGLRKIYD